MNLLCLRFFNFSIDDCDGTGDHENYFKDITDAYEINGAKYTDCRKIAVSCRSKDEHAPLSRLNNVFWLRNEVTKPKHVIKWSKLVQQQEFNNKEIIDSKFS